MPKKRVLWTFLILLSVVAASSGHVDSTSKGYAENALRNALVTFAVARTLNGVISVAQGTQLAIEPGGVGVNLSVGEILDPINDLVERFSAVMLVAASSLGLQTLLLNITAWWGFSAFLALASIAFLITLWMPRPVVASYANPALRILLIILFVRFAAPVLIIGTNIITDMFLASGQAEATAILEATTSNIEELNQETQSVSADEPSILDRLGNFIGNSIESLRVSDRLARLRESASNASEHIVNLIAIFVLQTIILPLLFLWLFAQGLKAIAFRSTRL